MFCFDQCDYVRFSLVELQLLHVMYCILCKPGNCQQHIMRRFCSLTWYNWKQNDISLGNPSGFNFALSQHSHHQVNTQLQHAIFILYYITVKLPCFLCTSLFYCTTLSLLWVELGNKLLWWINLSSKLHLRNQYKAAQGKGIMLSRFPLDLK